LKTYIIDIDDTICITPRVSGKAQYQKALPIQYRINACNALYDAGNVMIYWTARGSSSGIDYLEITRNQLTEWGVKASDIRVGKPSYDVWVDDKAFHDSDFFDAP